MKDFVKPTKTINEMMEQKGFTFFKAPQNKTDAWVAKLVDAEDDITGMDKFLVVDADDVTTVEIWEFHPDNRKGLNDDEVAQKIANCNPEVFQICSITCVPWEYVFFTE